MDSDYVELARHIRLVQFNLVEVAHRLLKRGVEHDVSKYSEEEYPLLRLKSKLMLVVYGSEEYFKILLENKIPIAHHHKINSHHPEHYNRLGGMDLFDLFEMLCDWLAASSINGTKLEESFNISCDWFGITGELRDILENTYREMGDVR